MLKLYFDTHVAKQIALQLRAKGVNVVRCEEVNMATASDEEHLEYATQEKRTIVSYDADFLRLHAQWISEAKPHTGIIRLSRYLQGAENIGRIVNELFDYHLMIESETGTVEDDIYNQVTFIK